MCKAKRNLKFDRLASEQEIIRKLAKVPKRQASPIEALFAEAQAKLTKKGTAAHFARLRHLNRQLCGCNRCLFAERDVATPALTFAEWDRRQAEWAEIVTTPDRHRNWTAILSDPIPTDEPEIGPVAGTVFWRGKAA